jgi:hypothetical protein
VKSAFWPHRPDRTVSCPWCGSEVEVTYRGGASVYCGWCLHRADRPRKECDCPACEEGRLEAMEEVALDEALYDIT